MLMFHIFSKKFQNKASVSAEMLGILNIGYWSLIGAKFSHLIDL